MKGYITDKREQEEAKRMRLESEESMRIANQNLMGDQEQQRPSNELAFHDANDRSKQEVRASEGGSQQGE